MLINGIAVNMDVAAEIADPGRTHAAVPLGSPSPGSQGELG
ncbi:MAG: hypothetical protein AB1556_16295 [Bacillota bacterium]